MIWVWFGTLQSITKVFRYIGYVSVMFYVYSMYVLRMFYVCSAYVLAIISSCSEADEGIRGRELGIRD